jgi:hypothetical protein
VVVALALSSLGFTTSRGAAATFTLTQWSMQYLQYLGSPAKSASDARVQFLEKWGAYEASFFLGNVNNPLDTKMSGEGARLWNQDGVRRYPNLQAGFAATRATMSQRFDRPILAALRTTRVTTARLTTALGQSNWTGDGANSSGEVRYAYAISGVLVVPRSEVDPTASISGSVRNATGGESTNLCVTAQSDTLNRSVASESGGDFTITGLPQGNYRIRVSYCYGPTRLTPALYDLNATPRYTSRDGARATVLRASCAATAICRDEHYVLRGPIAFGIAQPKLTWVRPPTIDFGKRLTSRQLDARASVRGTFRYFPAEGAVLQPGLRTLRVSFRPRDMQDYAPREMTITIEVRRASPRLSWPVPNPIVEGSPLSATQLDARASVAGSFAYESEPGTLLPLGNHLLLARFTPSAQREYQSATVGVIVAVIPAGG